MFISLSQLKIEVKKADIYSSYQYKKYRKKNRKKHWPSNPNSFYKEWINWNDLFGKEKITLSQLKIELRKAGIKSRSQYFKNRKRNWHSQPDKYYKYKWKSWNDLFGKEKVDFISLSQLKIELKKAGINSCSQYVKNKKKHWPSKPSRTYKDEWISWNDLFGKEKVKFISLSQLKVEIKKAKINSCSQYKKNRKKHWPSQPDKCYKDKWISWNDLFGEEKAEYVSLSQLKIEVKKARINSSIQYHKNRKKHWPSTPRRTYKEEWISWNDLFGKNFNLKKYIVRKLSAINKF